MFMQAQGASQKSTSSTSRVMMRTNEPVYADNTVPYIMIDGVSNAKH